MNKTQALAALRKLYGKSAAYRYDEKALVGEAREAAEVAMTTASLALTEAKAARDARRAELLKDPEYQRLCELMRETEKAHSRARGNYFHRRATVGHSAGLFFCVEGEGDNWQDAIDAARAKRQKDGRL